MSTLPTQTRVFVQWTEPCVFAGEDIECHITFKNVAPESKASKVPATTGFTLDPESRRNSIPSRLFSVPSQTSEVSSSRGGLKQYRGHRPTLSLSAPSKNSSPGTWLERSGRGASHTRSISIVSLNASDSFVNNGSWPAGGAETATRSARGHGRSASVQIGNRKRGSNMLPGPSRSSSQSHIMNESSIISLSNRTGDISLQERIVRRQSGISTAPNTPGIYSHSRSAVAEPLSSPGNFKFPSKPSANHQEQDSNTTFNDDNYFNPKLGSEIIESEYPKLVGEQSASRSRNTVLPRVLSPASNLGTPRSSGEFYSLSNNSTETLASEYIAPQNGRSAHRGNHSRMISSLGPAVSSNTSETLMMGYAQIHGSFTVDGSLVSQTTFDEVKRKGVVGGQGGGVIGLDSTKRESGLLRGLGWGSLGESLGSFLGSGELSSIKEMRGTANSKSVPLLSTPQSILFVDLRLEPGESRTFHYSFKLPRGLPPTHRGKTIKVTYNLVVGTQRPGGVKGQQVNSVQIPFRVLGSVNSAGEVLGHDLLSPYILLRDQSRVRSLTMTDNGPLKVTSAKSGENLRNINSADNFLSYVDELLTRPRRNSNQALLSPNENTRSRRTSVMEAPTTAKEAIDLAIIRSNVTLQGQQSANRFDIARLGQRVATIILGRPAYRLGETVNVALDFTNAELPIYAINASLESSEKVDASIALRSEATIHRVTRKIHASLSESAIFARRLVFSPTIPATATPDFITSGISLEWVLRFEFIAPRGERGDLWLSEHDDLLEEVSRDERGVVFVAAQELICESFEVAVPIRVYGATGGQSGRGNDPLGFAV